MSLLSSLLVIRNLVLNTLVMLLYLKLALHIEVRQFNFMPVFVQHFLSLFKALYVYAAVELRLV